MAEAFLELIQASSGYNDYTDPINMFKNYDGSMYLKDLWHLSTSKIFAIGGYPRSFNKCSNLSYINLPNVRTIVSDSFQYLSNLNYIFFSDIEILGYGGGIGPFQYDSGLKSINVQNVEFIAPYTFYGAHLHSINAVINLQKCKYIGDNAFQMYPMSNESFEIITPNVECIGAQSIFDTWIKYIDLPDLKHISPHQYKATENYRLVDTAKPCLSYINLGKIEDFKPPRYMSTSQSYSAVYGLIYNLPSYVESSNIFRFSVPNLKGIYSMRYMLGYKTNISNYTVSIYAPELEKIIDADEVFYGIKFSEISFPKLRYIQNRSGNSVYYYFYDPYSSNFTLKDIYLPELEYINSMSYFMYFNTRYHDSSNFVNVYMPKLRYISKISYFMFGFNISKLDFPELRKIYKLYSDAPFYFYSHNYNYSYALKRANFPKLKCVEPSFLMNNKSLSELNIPVCEKIGRYAFQSCESIPSLSINICSTIDMCAFQSCWGLRKIFAETLESISTSTFNNCYMLKYLYAPELKFIGPYGFGNCQLGAIDFNNVETMLYAGIECSTLGYTWYECKDGKPDINEYGSRSVVLTAYHYSTISYSDTIRSYSNTLALYSSDEKWYCEGSVSGEYTSELSYAVDDWMDNVNLQTSIFNLPNCKVFNDGFGSQYSNPFHSIYMPNCENFTLNCTQYSSYIVIHANKMPNLKEINLGKISYIEILNTSCKKVCISGLSSIYINGLNSKNFYIDIGMQYTSSDRYTHHYIEDLYLDDVITIQHSAYLVSTSGYIIHDWIYGLKDSLKKISFDKLKFYYGWTNDYYNGGFFNMNELSEIDAPNLEYAHNMGFAGCSKLSKINLYKLKALHINDAYPQYSECLNPKYYGTYFQDCTSLKTLSLYGLEDIFYSTWTIGSSKPIFPDNLEDLYFYKKVLCFRLDDGYLWQPYNRRYVPNDFTIYENEIYSCLSDHITSGIFISSYWSLTISDLDNYSLNIANIYSPASCFRFIFGNGNPRIHVPQSLYSYYSKTFFNYKGNVIMCKESISDWHEYTPHMVSVTYHVDTGVSYTEQVQEGKAILHPSTFTPSKVGYSFEGWAYSIQPYKNVLKEAYQEDPVTHERLILSPTADGDEIDLYAIFHKNDGQFTTILYNGNNVDTYTDSAGEVYYNNGTVISYSDLKLTLTQNALGDWEPLGWTDEDDEIPDIMRYANNQEINYDDITLYGCYYQTVKVNYIVPYYTRNMEDVGNKLYHSLLHEVDSYIVLKDDSTFSEDLNLKEWHVNDISGTLYELGANYNTSIGDNILVGIYNIYPILNSANNCNNPLYWMRINDKNVIAHTNGFPVNSYTPSEKSGNISFAYALNDSYIIFKWSHYIDPQAINPEVVIKYGTDIIYESHDSTDDSYKYFSLVIDNYDSDKSITISYDSDNGGVGVRIEDICITNSLNNFYMYDSDVHWHRGLHPETMLNSSQSGSSNQRSLTRGWIYEDDATHSKFYPDPVYPILECTYINFHDVVLNERCKIIYDLIIDTDWYTDFDFIIENSSNTILHIDETNYSTSHNELIYTIVDNTFNITFESSISPVFETLVPIGDENPLELEWYEYPNLNYIPTQDRHVDETKTYYKLHTFYFKIDKIILLPPL